MLLPSTLKFLNHLKKNNNKPWFDEHRKEYNLAKENFVLLLDELIPLITKFDTSIAHLNSKDCIFRINRDVRFSKDKSPYKTNIAGYFNQNGKKGLGAGYYLHIEPDKSFLAGGMWMPEPKELAKIRQEIDYSFDEWKRFTGSAVFRKTFPEGVKGEALIRPPKGYDENNAAIEFIKLKSFVVTQPFTDAAVLNKDFIKNACSVFKAMKPLVDFLNAAVN